MEQRSRARYELCSWLRFNKMSCVLTSYLINDESTMNHEVLPKPIGRFVFFSIYERLGEDLPMDGTERF